MTSPLVIKMFSHAISREYESWRAGGGLDRLKLDAPFPAPKVDFGKLYDDARRALESRCGWIESTVGLPYITRRHAHALGLRYGEYNPAAESLPLTSEVSMSGKVTINGQGFSLTYALKSFLLDGDFVASVGDLISSTGAGPYSSTQLEIAWTELNRLRDQYQSLLKTCEAAQAEEKRRREQMEQVQRMLFGANAEGPDVFARLQSVIDRASDNSKERDRFVRQQSDSNAKIGNLMGQILDLQNKLKAAEALKKAEYDLRLVAFKVRDDAMANYTEACRERNGYKEALDLRSTENANLTRVNNDLSERLKISRGERDALQRACDDQKAEFETACALFDLQRDPNDSLAKQVIEGAKSGKLQVSHLQGVIGMQRERIQRLEAQHADAQDEANKWAARFHWLAKETMYRIPDGWTVTGHKWHLTGYSQAEAVSNAITRESGQKVNVAVDMAKPGADTACMAQMENGKIVGLSIVSESDVRLAPIPENLNMTAEGLKNQINFVIEAVNRLADKVRGK